MKKVAVIFVAVFLSLLVLSSCNRQSCPAYSKADNDKAEQVG